MSSETIALAPLVAWPLIAVIAGMAAVLAGLALVRGSRGAVLRALALIVLIGALLEPRLIRETREPRPDLAVLVVDATPSQSVGERPAETGEALARLQASLALLPDLETRVLEVAGSSGEAQTRLFAALEKAGLEQDADRLAGVVLLTDGQVHDVPAPSLPAWLQAPLHVLLTGRPGERDRRIVIEQAPAYGLVGNTVEIAYRVDDLGPPLDPKTTPAPAAVTIKIGGEPAATIPVTPGQRQLLPVTLSRGGPLAVELSVEPAVAEVSLRNNQAAIVVNAVRDRLKVLLVSGQPHPGERAWRNLLKSDPSVDLVHFTILRPPDKDDAIPLDRKSVV